MLPIRILFVLLFIAVFFAFVVAMRKSPEERVLQRRVADIRNPRRSSRPEDSGDDLEDEYSENLTARLGSYLRRYSFSKKLEQLLLEADSSATVGSVAMNSMLSGTLLALASLLLLHAPLLVLAGAAAGGLLPTGRLQMKKRARLKAATAALPDAVDLMARALRSGHSMIQTIELVAEQAPKPLGTEFGRVFQQQKLGVQLRDVLMDMGSRLPSRDLQFLITAILVQRETGGDLAVILDRTAVLLRERVHLQAQVQVHTAQGRMTGWILSLMPVVLLGAMMLFSPHYTRILFDDPAGKKLLYTGAGLIVTGGLIIRKIVAVEV